MAKFIHIQSVLPPENVAALLAAWEHVGVVKNISVVEKDNNHKKVEMIVELSHAEDASLYVPDFSAPADLSLRFAML